MNFLPVYLDSSSLLKLIFPERESAALRETLERWPDWITSQLSVVECHRAVRRAGGGSRQHEEVDHLLASCTVLRFDEPLVHLAGRIGPPRLRSLDAIHLASALSIGDYPEAFVTYDQRLAEAARAVGLNVLMPE